MFCPHCGAINSKDAKFCNECGCKFVTVAVKPDETTHRSNSKIQKTKEEYIRELEHNDTGYQVAGVVQWRCLFMCLIFVVIGSTTTQDKGFNAGAPFFVLSALCFLGFILDSAYLIYKNNKNRDAYEDYLKYGDNYKNDDSARERSTPVITHERYWDCPNCGRCNDNYITTCKCGERKP